MIKVIPLIVLSVLIYFLYISIIVFKDFLNKLSTHDKKYILICISQITFYLFLLSSYLYILSSDDILTKIGKFIYKLFN